MTSQTLGFSYRREMLFVNGKRLCEMNDTELKKEIHSNPDWYERQLAQQELKYREEDGNEE